MMEPEMYNFFSTFDFTLGKWTVADVIAKKASQKAPNLNLTSAMTLRKWF